MIEDFQKKVPGGISARPLILNGLLNEVIKKIVQTQPEANKQFRLFSEAMQKH